MLPGYGDVTVDMIDETIPLPEVLAIMMAQYLRAAAVVCRRESSTWSLDMIQPRISQCDIQG